MTAQVHRTGRETVQVMHSLGVGGRIHDTGRKGNIKVRM